MLEASVVSDQPVSGHVFRVDRRRGPQWYVKYRLPDGRQQQKRLGPAWSGRGRPPAGYLTKRIAEAALREILVAARDGRLPGQQRSGASFADACADFLQWIEHDRGRKRSTLNDYRSAVRAHLLPAFGHLPLEGVDRATIDRWRTALVAAKRLSPRSVNKLAILHGFFERARRVHGLPVNPVAEVEKQPRKRRVSIDVYSSEEVLALVRGAVSDRTARSTSPRPSPDCAWASCWHSAGAMLTSSWRRSRSVRATRTANSTPRRTTPAAPCR